MIINLIRVFLVLAVIYHARNTLIIEKLKTTGIETNFKIVKKKCGRPRKRHVIIIVNGGEHKIPLNFQQCKSIEEYGNIKLYYSKKHKLFHVPGSIFYLMKLCLISLCAFFSFLPWNRWFAKT